MFYDKSAGTAQFFVADGTGGLHPLGVQMSLGTNWSAIHATGFCEFLLYDAANGVGEYRRTDTLGHMTLLKQYTDWRRTWSIIAPGVYADTALEA